MKNILEIAKNNYLFEKGQRKPISKKIQNRNQSKATLKRCVFRWRLKMSILLIKRNSDGREFHSLGRVT